MQPGNKYREKRSLYMSLTCGIIAADMTNNVDGDAFFDFVRATLIPNMLPFNSLNKRSVLIMDNCSVHHIEPVTTLLQ